MVCYYTFFVELFCVNSSIELPENVLGLHNIFSSVFGIHHVVRPLVDGLSNFVVLRFVHTFSMLGKVDCNTNEPGELQSFLVLIPIFTKLITEGQMGI